MRLARWVFLAAGAFGLIPALHWTYTMIIGGPELLPDLASTGLFLSVSVFQYGLWQVLMIVLATDPVRYRPMMIVAFFVQVTAAFNPAWLFLYGAVFGFPIVFVDLLFAILFVVAFWVTGRETAVRLGTQRG
jgi:hypothetical protein